MKRLFNKMAIVFAVVLFTGSCSKENKLAPATLEEKIAKDASLKQAIESATDLYQSLSKTYVQNPAESAELEQLAAKINNKTATAQDFSRVQQITGVSYDVFIGKIRNFALALNNLNKSYPELSKMKQQDLQKTLSKAIELNPELKNSLGKATVINGRTEACPLRDICNLAVTLTKLFAGDAICTAISVTTIPVVGGLLCSLVLSLGAGLLTAICNALPC